MEKTPRNLLSTLLSLPARALIGLIRFYQATLSPDHGPLRHLYRYGYCRHEPTCSEYAVDVLRSRSLPMALALIVKRVLSCNPWTKPTDQRLRSAILKSITQN